MREMKDSGIEWIGNVPATWERCKIKNVISSIGSGTTPTSSNIDYYNSEDICWIQSGDLYKICYRKLIIFLEILKCRQSLMFQGFPAFLVTEDVLKSP